MTIGIDSSQSECSENVGIAESNQRDGRSEQDESPAVSPAVQRWWQELGKPSSSKESPSTSTMTPAERRALVDKPFPPIGLIVTHGAHSRGGVEVGSDEELFMRKARGSRKPSLSDYEGG